MVLRAPLGVRGQDGRLPPRAVEAGASRLREVVLLISRAAGIRSDRLFRKLKQVGSRVCAMVLCGIMVLSLKISEP